MCFFSQFFRRKSAIPARWAALTWSADLVWPIAWLGGFMLNRSYLMNISIDFTHIIISCWWYWSCYIMFMRKIPNWLKVGFGVFHKSNCFPILNIFSKILDPAGWNITKQAGDVLNLSQPGPTCQMLAVSSGTSVFEAQTEPQSPIGHAPIWIKSNNSHCITFFRS